MEPNKNRKSPDSTETQLLLSSTELPETETYPVSIVVCPHQGAPGGGGGATVGWESGQPRPGVRDSQAWLSQWGNISINNKLKSLPGALPPSAFR